MRELEILKLARGYIAQGWCKELAKCKSLVWLPQGEFIPDNPKDPKSPTKFVDATHWSVVGAILRAEVAIDGGLGKVASHPLFASKAIDFINAAVNELGYRFIHYYEDPDKSKGTRKVEEVLSVIDRAIELAQ